MRSPLRWPVVALLALYFCTAAQENPVANPSDFHWNWRDSRELKADQSLRTSTLKEESKNAIAKTIADQIRPNLEIKTETELKERAFETRVTFLDLNGDGVPEVIAQGMTECSATGNCPFWVLKKSKPSYEVILEGEAQMFTVQRTSTNGFRDIVLSTHGSYSSGRLTNYHYESGVYVDAGCYSYEWTVLEGQKVRELKEPRVTPCSQ